jgi:hypothetical protein
MKPPSPLMARTGVLDAQCGRKAPAEIVLIARRDVGARPIDRIGQPGREAHLGHFLHENAILRQRGPDRVQKADEGAEASELEPELSLPRHHILAPRWARLIILRDEVNQAAQDRLGVAHQGDRGRLPARRLLRIGVKADHREVVIHAPLVERDVQMRADPEHSVGLSPQLVPERQGHAHGIARVEDATAAPKGQDRGLQ